MRTMDREGLARPVQVHLVALNRAFSSGCLAAVTAAGMALLAGSAITVAQDSRMTAVPVAGIDETSWLCALDSGDPSPRPGRGVNIGVGLCQGSFAVGAVDLPPAAPGPGQGGSLSDPAFTGAGILTPAGLSPAGHVDIPDTGLRRALEQALGKWTDEPISPVDMAGLTSLVARRAGIADLSGLEFAVRLRHLDLYGNAVTDLSPLDDLIGLQMLSVAHNGIGDDAFATISLLTGLEVLSLAGNPLDDLSPLANLSGLRVLDLTSTTVEDILPLQGLSQLEGLYLGDNGIDDANALGGMPYLRWLLLTDNAIEDISPLTVLTELDFLGLADNAVEDIFPLVQNSGLAAGDVVVLSGNPLNPVSRDELIPDLRSRGVVVHFDVAPPSVEFGAQRIITTNADRAFSVHAADLDGDGDPDVLSASADDDKIAWYENLGGGAFSTQQVITAAADGTSSVHAADLDGDGDPDVLSASQLDDKVAWYENLGGGAFSVQRVITTAADGASSVHAADLDGDGDPDVLSASLHGDTIAWYENMGGGAFSAQRVIATADAAFSVRAADLDGDGDPDVLTNDNDQLVWYENEGGAFSQKRVFSGHFSGQTPGLWHIYSADLDGDGDVDVLANSDRDSTFVWHENLGGGEFSSQQHFSGSAYLGGSVRAADLDGDGDQDVLSASRGDDKIAWYENLGGGSFSAQSVITTDADGAHSVQAADLDGDGDPDVLSASANDDTIAWYENLSNHGDDHGNAPSAATLATALPAFLHGTLESGGDRDVFRVATGSGRLRVYSNGPTDTRGTLFDGAGNQLATNDDAGASTNFMIDVDVTAGTYYVQVHGFSSATTGPYTLSIEWAGLDVAQFLAESPRIAAAMLWHGTDNVAMPYADWPETLKAKLDIAVRRQLAGEGSGLPDVMTNQAGAFLADNDYVTTVLSGEDAEDLYAASVANSLVLEMLGTLPWSLDDLSEDELTLLLDSRGFYRGYADYLHDANSRVTGYDVDGIVLPAPPEIVREFMAREDLVGASRHETIINAIDWIRYNLVHYSGGQSAKNFEDHWGYRGYSPLSRMLVVGEHTGLDGKPRGYTAGCHGTNWFLVHLLRAVNIPVEYVLWAGHAIPSFPSEGIYLSHGDDPYSSFAQYSPPFPEPFPTSELPIPEATYQEWFNASNSPEENLRNVGRKVTELGVEHLPQALLRARCSDRANGLSNESSYVYSPQFAGIGNFWTVAELEAMRFWERMDEKIAQYGGCSIFGY